MVAPFIDTDHTALRLPMSVYLLHKKYHKKTTVLFFCLCHSRHTRNPPTEHPSVPVVVDCWAQWNVSDHWRIAATAAPEGMVPEVWHHVRPLDQSQKLRSCLTCAFERVNIWNGDFWVDILITFPCKNTYTVNIYIVHDISYTCVFLCFCCDSIIEYIHEYTLGIQSPSENGNGTQILCWGCDWTSQSSAENMTGCLGIDYCIINKTTHKTYDSKERCKCWILLTFLS